MGQLIRRKWINRALSDKERIYTKGRQGPPSSVRTLTFSDDKYHYVAPTIRKMPHPFERPKRALGEKPRRLKQLTGKRAVREAVKQRDAIRFKTHKEADEFSHQLSDLLGRINE